MCSWLLSGSLRRGKHPWRKPVAFSAGEVHLGARPERARPFCRQIPCEREHGVLSGDVAGVRQAEPGPCQHPADARVLMPLVQGLGVEQ